MTSWTPARVGFNPPVKWSSASAWIESGCGHLNTTTCAHAEFTDMVMVVVPGYALDRFAARRFRPRVSGVRRAYITEDELSELLKGWLQFAVRKYLDQAGPVRKETAPRARPVWTKVEQRIKDLLAESKAWTGAKQQLTATRLHDVLVGEGQQVGVTRCSVNY